MAERGKRKNELRKRLRISGVFQGPIAGGNIIRTGEEYRAVGQVRGGGWGWREVGGVERSGR